MAAATRPGTAWLTERASYFVDLLNERGMTMPEDQAAEVISQRVELTAARLRLTSASAQCYLTDEVLADMASTLTAGRAHEAPGEDLTTAHRSARIRIDTLGRLVAGLAETARLYTDHTKPSRHCSH